MGTVEEARLEELTELLIGLSGTQPEPLEQHEVVLRPPAAAATGSGVPAAWKPDLRLQHDLAGAIGNNTVEQEDKWTVLQFSLHLRGKQHAALPATVRHVTRAQCAGDNVPSFWEALGFSPRYQLLRRGHFFLVPLCGQEVQVSVCRVLRLPPPPSSANAAAAAAAASSNGSSSGRGGSSWAGLDSAALQQAEELSPGRRLVEAVVAVPSEADHMESVGALASLAALLQPLTTLQRPPRAPGEPL